MNIKKAVFAIVLITLVVYANSLFNGFVGDDEVVIVHNTFYRDSHNVFRIFDRSYLTDSNQVFIKTRGDFHSGSVAYRPILSLTYFLDYFFWELNPFGYHLTNLGIHLANSILVFLLLFKIIANPAIAILGAILFDVHPIQSEAVCNIGYRADVLALFFSLVAVLSFIKFSSSADNQRFLWHMFSFAGFFLAVFSKESAIVVPFLIIVYDIYKNNMIFCDIRKYFISRYGGFLIVGLMYVCVYIFIFPNTTLKAVLLSRENMSSHFFTTLNIWIQYVVSLLNPLSVKILPPQYAPTVFTGHTMLLLAGLLSIAAGVWILRQKDILTFFLLWFLIGILPVANIVSLPNPMAWRFMYLPSVGFLAVLAFYVQAVSQNQKVLKIFPNGGKLIKGIVIGVCMVCTISFNGFWQSNYAVASQIMKNFPENSWGHSILGLEYFRAAMYTKACVHLEESVRLGSQDPRVFFMLGSVASKDSFLEAENYFKTAIRLKSDYEASHFSLGRLYYLHKDYEKALSYFKNSLMLDESSYDLYEYLILTYTALKRYDEADQTLKQARENFRDQRQLDHLKSLVKTHNVDAL